MCFLARETAALDRAGKIPQFMKDAWVKKYGSREPTHEVGYLRFLVWVDAVANNLLPRLFYPLLVVSMALSYGAYLRTIEGKSGSLFALLSLLSILATFAVKVLPFVVVNFTQIQTAGNMFNCRLGTLWGWICEKENESLSDYSEFELRHFAEEILIQQAQKVLLVENEGGQLRKLKKARDDFSWKYEVLNDFGLVDCPWRPIFSEAARRLDK